MSEAPPNSHASKKEREAPEAVATGKFADETIDIQTPKEGLGKRLFKQFFAMGAKEMWKNLQQDVVIPSAKNIASDLIVGAKDLMLFGSSAKTPSGQTDYAAISKPKNNLSIADRSNFNFKNILFDSRKDAIDVLRGLQKNITEYGEVTVGAFYNLANMENSFNDYSYGWKSLSGADVKQVAGNRWMLILPPVVKLAE